MELEDTLSASLAMAGTLADTAGPLLQAYSPGASTTSSSSSRVSIPAGSSTGNGKNGAGQLGGPATSSTEDRPGTGSKAATAVMLLECSVHLLDHAKRQAAALTQPPDQEQQEEEGPAAGLGLCQQVADIQQQVRQVVQQ